MTGIDYTDPAEYLDDEVQYVDFERGSLRNGLQQEARKISLRYASTIPSVDSSLMISLGRWLADTPPAIARALSGGEAWIAVNFVSQEDRVGMALAQTARLYLKARLPASVTCTMVEGGEPGLILVEIRRAG